MFSSRQLVVGVNRVAFSEEDEDGAKDFEYLSVSALSLPILDNFFWVKGLRDSSNLFLCARSSSLLHHFLLFCLI